MSKPLIALHQGKGFISNAIRWQSRGTYSHASVVLPNGAVIESREFVGVSALQRLALNKDAFIDLFEINCPLPKMDEGIGWLISQAGKQYDYSSVLRFISRRQESRTGSGKWFCSELAFAFVQQCGVDLFRDTQPWEVSPGMLAKSPLLKFKERIE